MSCSTSRAGTAHLQLLVGDGHFLTQLGRCVFKLFTNAPHAGVESETRFHADDEQVQHVGELQEDLSPAALA